MRFPVEAVRDLLGLARALARAERRARGPLLRIERLEDVARSLATSIELAVGSPDDSVGARAAWARAEDASRRLGELVGAFDRAEPVVAAACGAVLGAGARGGLDRAEAPRGSLHADDLVGSRKQKRAP